MFVLVVPLVPSPFTMTISAVPGDVVAGIVAFLHVYFMCLETFMWRGRARKVFGTPRAIADITANLAANQGYYNFILAMGLVYGIAKDAPLVKAVLLAGVVGAGVFGALTVSFRILFFQSIPATIGFVLVVLSAQEDDELIISFVWFAGFAIVSAAMGLFVGRREAAFKKEAGASSGTEKSRTSSTGHQKMQDEDRSEPTRT